MNERCIFNISFHLTLSKLSDKYTSCSIQKIKTARLYAEATFNDIIYIEVCEFYFIETIPTPLLMTFCFRRCRTICRQSICLSLTSSRSLDFFFVCNVLLAVYLNAFNGYLISSFNNKYETNKIFVNA
jgi:hypothetical protein